MTDWIEWKGGECPVADDAIVEAKMPYKPGGVRFRRAGDCDWSHEGIDTDIIAYRVVEA